MIRNKIFRNLILFTSVPFLIIAVYLSVYTYQKNTMEVRGELTDKLNRTVDAINETIVKYIDKSSYIITNKYLINNIDKDYSYDLEQMFYFIDNVNAMIGEAYTGNVKSPYIIHAYNEKLFEGKFFESMAGLEGHEAVARARLAAPTEIVWEPEPTIKNDLPYLTFYRNIVNTTNSVGILEVNIPYKALETIMDSMGVPDNGIIYSSLPDGRPMHKANRPDGNEIDPGRVSADDYFMASSQVKNGSTITIATPRQAVYLKNALAFAVVAASFLAYILVMLLASRMTAQKITNNMENFINKLKRNDDMLLHEELIQIKGSDEVSILKLKFKDLVSRMNEMYKEMMSVKLENNAMEVELLQARINPHLLYNSLSVIKWTALWNKDRNTVELIDAMTKYYRTALNKGNNIISISSELDMIREYVKINRFAHSADYALHIDVQEEILAFHTLKHLLQPIVENAVLHGLNGLEEEARIVINGYLEERDIVFEVIDNGRGMDRDTVGELLNFSYAASFGGYGIRNVMKRIQTYYGGDYGLRIESAIGSGTKVTVRIKALSEEQLKEKMRSSTAIR
ncbi:sensor histidine kinase [Paenibacillus contaminans]|uniref:Histidine kinase/HSP90-like ATPase domain-containing protein n=1 Tax=Paenibacillus contaminans TaxID=450362 RepID=A0A329LZ67_9BACL|nr:histidine kinase [Paenibacillus contaminans]RAV09937.1 hypothetical protein DQG23_38815 [Paenibacillus contaminans]